MEIAEDRDSGDCSQRAPASALGFDRGAGQDKQRRQRSHHNHGCNRNSHLDCNFKDCRVSIVPNAPAVEIVGSERGKQIGEGANPGTQKRPLPNGLNAKPVDGPSRIIEQPLAPNPAHVAEQRDGDRKRHASAEATTCQNLDFCLLATIRMIATSNPRQEQIKPPREPVKSSAKKHASAARRSSNDPECEMLIRCGSAATAGSTKIEAIAARKRPEQNHRIAPAPTKVAAVLWLTKVAVRLPR